MPREETKSKSAGPVVAVVIVAVMLPVLYLLSIGPVVRLYKLGWISESVGVIYVPLVFVASWTEPLDRVLNWYVELWQR